MTVEDNSPIISVVMPVYKEPVSLLKRSTDSILNQTFKNLELIVVLDDPKNSEAIQLLKEYAATEPRFLYLIHESNKGISVAVNNGIKLARGKFIARQDADDVSHLNRLECQYNYMVANPKVDVLGTALMFIDSESDLRFEMKYKPVVGGEINRICPVGAGSVLIKKEAFFQNGFYGEGLTAAEDYDLWMRWYSKGIVFHNLQDVLYDYYAPNSIRIKRIKPYLIKTIKCKLNNNKNLNFRLKDFFYLFAQMLCALLPGFIIHKLFYFLYGMNQK